VPAALAIAFGSRVRARRSLAQESAVVGTVGAVALALGYLFLSLYGGILESLETLLFGSFVGITRGQVQTLLIVAIVAAAVLAAVGRPLFYASVDERAARADGVPVRALSVVFLVLLALAVAAIAQIVGVLLTFALLVAPAATAQLLTTRLRLSLALAVALAVAETWAALTVSYFTNVAMGFAVTTIALAIYACARGARKLRG
jgi:zinc/manganese transport system permease protein